MIVPVMALAFAFSASLALAEGSCCQLPQQKCCPSLTITNDNFAKTVTTSLSSANTGSNQSLASGSFLTTGAASAGSQAGTDANSSKIIVGQPASGTVTIKNSNVALTMTGSTATANTGNNSSMFSKFGFTSTGAAGASSSAMTVANSSVIVMKK